MTHDVLVIGAGPAGVAAALKTTSLGLRTALLDDQQRPGGQIYRNVGIASSAVSRLLGPDYSRGRTLIDGLTFSGVELYLAASVWDVARDLTVSAVCDGKTAQLKAPQLIVATGAMERASPMPGWTLPGVMNAGAAQIALKSAACVPSGRVVLVGCGPLLLLVACQLLDAGANLAAIVETSPRMNSIHALRHLPEALRRSALLRKGWQMISRLRSSGVSWFKHAAAVAIEGNSSVSAVRFRAAGRDHHIGADTVLLHHGVIPNTQLTRLMRIEHHWNESQLSWRASTDEWGGTNIPGVRVAGDGAGIRGAIAAEASGSIAGLRAAHALGRINDAKCALAAAQHRQVLADEESIRPFLDAMYRPPDWVLTPADEVTVCRCEEVTAGAIRSAARLGCEGPNQTKFFSRCGMGACQGRTCGTVVTQLLAQVHKRPPQEVGMYRVRPPLKPLPLRSVAEAAAVYASSPEQDGTE